MKNLILRFILILPILIISACTDLEEIVLDESFTGTGLAESVSGAIAPAYGQLPIVWLHTNNFGLQEIASDEAILPHRGGTDWFDGGKFIAVHTHTTTPTNSLVGDTWSALTINISRALSAIEALRPLAESGNNQANEALQEMIALRAYLSMILLDNWGLVFKKENSTELSEILKGQEAIDYIENEFLSVVETISTDKGPGRISQTAVWGFLARLYLNAAVYRAPYETPNFTSSDMEKVIDYTSRIIGSGRHTLSPAYFDLFNDNNSSNQELIFAIDQRGVLPNEHSRWTYWSLAGSLFGRPEFPASDGTDGPAVTTDFYQSWLDAYDGADPTEMDVRFFQQNQNIPENLLDLSGVNPSNDENHFYCISAEDFEFNRGIIRGVIWGPRKDATGAFLRCDGDNYRIYPVIQTKGNGPDRNVGYINHTLTVDYTNEGRLHNTGFRFSKYQFSRTSPNANNFSSVDLVLLRLAEVYLMRAEAKFRVGDVAGALMDVNTLRTSRNARQPVPAALSSVDLEVLFREYGFEFYWEGQRRNHQIRFGKYEDSWTEKTDNTVTNRLFPIPQFAIDGASNTEGFLEQNSGY